MKRALLLLLLLAACTPSTPAGQGMVVVTSSYPLWYFASQIADGKASVVNLVPPGVEPHDWEPQPSDVRLVAQAAVIVYNGGGLEKNIARLLSGARGDAIIVESVKGLQDSNAQDPHVWLDPMLAAQQAKAIGTALRSADPSNAALYQERTDALVKRLDALDEQFSTGLKQCARTSFITSHEAFGHLAAAFSLKQYSISGLTPDAEPSPRKVTELVQLAGQENIKYVLVEPLGTTKLAQTIADEIGGSTLALDPLEVMTKAQMEAGQDYFSVMGQNLINLRTALGCP